MTTRLADVIVHDQYLGYTQTQTELKSHLIQTGVMVEDPDLVELVEGKGNTTTVPTWLDLARDEENTVTDADADRIEATRNNAWPNPSQDAVPGKITTTEEIAVRLERHKSWGANRLTAQLAGSDPMMAIGDFSAGYWTDRWQALFISVMSGVFGANDAGNGNANAAGDFTRDISGGATPAERNISGNALIDTLQTMGDSKEDLGIMFVHSVIESQMRKLKLLEDNITIAENLSVPVYQGKIVIQDDSMPSPAANTYETWVFGTGAVRYARRPSARNLAVEIERNAAAGNGAGVDVLHNRWAMSMHPNGHAYVGAATSGGPLNAVLAAAASWEQRFPERKQIKIARLITDETA